MKNITKLMLAMFILVALAFTINAETIHLTYTYPADDYVVAENTTNVSVNITVPKTDLDLDIASEDNSVTVSIPSLSIVGVAEINLSVKEIDESTIDDSSAGIGPSRRYRPKVAYAFSIDNEEQINGTYTVQINYTGAGVDTVYALKVFKFDYNFTDNSTVYSDYSIYTDPTHDENRKLISFTTKNFSNFVLVEDRNTPSSGSWSGGGGGGGGGGMGNSNLITVTPTIEGSFVRAPVNTIFNVVYDGQVYPVEFVFANGMYVKLKNMNTQEYWTFVTGIPKKLDFDGIGSDDVEVVLTGIDSKYGEFVFVLLDSVTPITSLAIIPPAKPKEPVMQEPEGEIVVQPPTQTQPAQPTAPAVATEPEPESTPISGWSIFLSILIIVLLIGGFFGYRRYLASITPPEIVKSGFGGSVTPPAQHTVEQVEEHVEETPIISKTVILEEQPKAHATVPTDRIKLLEKYVYHGLAQGFTEPQIRSALARKGWPESAVAAVFDHIGYTDEHLEAHDLHTHNDADTAVGSIRILLSEGFSEDHIREGLRRKGWSPEQIDNLFSMI